MRRYQRACVAFSILLGNIVVRQLFAARVGPWFINSVVMWAVKASFKGDADQNLPG